MTYRGNVETSKHRSNGIPNMSVNNLTVMMVNVDKQGIVHREWSELKVNYRVLNGWQLKDMGNIAVIKGLGLG